VKDIPAFPVVQECGENDPDLNGITIRDYFAAIAMHALLRNEPPPPHETDMRYREWADDAYQMASAMLKARRP